MSIKLRSALGACLLTLTACGGESGGPAETVGEATSPLWLSTSAALWSAPVPVCFASTIPAARRDTIKSTIENGWERAAHINFFGWGDCPTLTSTTTNLIVVSTDPTTPSHGLSESCSDATHCVGIIGKAPNGDFNRIRFDSDVEAAKPAVVLHEFGHAIGFLHESNDALESGAADPFCDQRTGGGTSLEFEGDSTRSVMTAYVDICNPLVTQLSSWDILGARAVYGMKTPGTLSGLNGIVLNIQGASTTLGTPIIGWDGDGNPNSVFQRRSTTSLLLRSMLGGTERVLNVSGGVVSPTVPTALVSWSANEADTNSQFHFKGVQWLAMGDRCVQASGNASGAELGIEICTTSNLQKWDFFEGDRRIRLNGTGLCVNIPNNNTALGTKPILFPCSTGTPFPNETFNFANGKIGFSDKDFNVSGGTIASGNRIVLWTPSSGQPFPNERFTLRGQVTALGQCVDMNGAPNPSVPMVVRTCAAISNPSASLTSSQIWEYWW